MHWLILYHLHCYPHFEHNMLFMYILPSVGSCTTCLRTRFHYFLPRRVHSGLGIVVIVLVRPYVRNFFWDFCFFVIVRLVVVDGFSFFEKNNFSGLSRSFFDRFFWYLRAYTGRAASQVIYAGKVLFADFEST